MQQTKNALECLSPHSLVYYKIYINKDINLTGHKTILPYSNKFLNKLALFVEKKGRVEK
jgi:hypothetical protein